MRQERFVTTGKVRLHVEDPAGSVAITTHDQPETIIELTMIRPGDDESMLDDARVESVARDGCHDVYVEVSGHRGGLGSMLRWLISHGGVDVEVRAPRGAELDVRTASARVDAQGQFADASIKTASGAVRLEGATGEVQIRTASGRVECPSLLGAASIATASGAVQVGSLSADTEITTASGRIEVDDAHARLEVRSASGSVDIGSVESDLRVETASGRQRIGRLVSGDGALTTVSGSIVAGVAQGSAIHLDAEAISGSLESEIALEEDSDASVPSGPSLDLKIRSVSGGVRIVRAGAQSAA
jgi:Putative adhesin